MKQLAVFITFLLLTGCQKDALLQPEGSAPQVNADPAIASTASAQTDKQAFNFHSTQDLAQQGSFYNYCTGESLTVISGTVLSIVHGVANKNKGSFAYSFIVQNLLLVDADGTEYHGNSVSHTIDNRNLTTGLIETGTISMVLTQPGGGNNLFAKAVFHFTIDESGNYNFIVNKFEITCR